MNVLRITNLLRNNKKGIQRILLFIASIIVAANWAGCARTAVKPPASVGASRAVGTLIAEGRELLASGQAAQAEATLERALRIDPRNPEPWYAMAQAKFAQGHNEQAIQFCQKSLALLTPSQQLWGQCWDLIGKAYGLMGQLEKSRQALEKAGRY